jgi:tetratricopeptide (TPR) repeat protein
MSIKSTLFLVVSLLLFISCQRTSKQLLKEAISLSKQKKYDKSVEVYTSLINRDSRFQIAYYNRGIAYMNIKKYSLAYSDFNQVMSMQRKGDYIINSNSNSPFANDYDKAQVFYFDALYQRAQSEFHLDSLKKAYIDFQILIDNEYSEKVNCLLWQGTIFLRAGNVERACTIFYNASNMATDESDKVDIEKMLITYCKKGNNNR